ncbi:MAG: hypothetical protein KGM39_04290 [Actinomycetales bacterium]|nr:hypothetical protein [Actinomycetales bacterium]
MTPDQEKPVRKTPKVRQSTMVTDSTVVAPKRTRAKVTPAVADIPKAKISQSSKTALLMVAAFLAGSIITYSFTSSSTPTPIASTSTFTDVIAGKVALTESELIAAVKKLGVDVYWAGPVNGAKYTLAVPADGQAYVRYLPNGNGLTDTKPNYVVIATYTTTNAFSATQAAGNQSNGVTFINAEGAAVYYNKDTPTNVYVAYPNLNYQIEVFDPIAATALDIASKQGALRLVK